ncbi:MAG: fluoride efflux transporter FluC [Acidimicrobiales bacterium]
MLPHAGAMALVLAGGFFGAAGREAVEQALPTVAGSFPSATLAINLAGAFALGLVLEVLLRAGGPAAWPRRARLCAGTGFLGAFTTYSTFAVQAAQLGRAGHVGTAAAYVVATVAGGLLAVAAGIFVAGGTARRGRSGLPVDPDVDPERPPR